MDKLFLLLVVDVNSVWNGLQVISGFVFRRRNGRKKNRNGSHRKSVFLPPVTPGITILPWNQFDVNSWFTMNHKVDDLAKLLVK